MIRFKIQVLGSFFILLAAISYAECATTEMPLKKDRIECYVEDDGPKDDPNNIYKCNKEAKCCKENALPSCCVEKPTDVAVWDQVKLWGTLSGLILILAIFMCCCRHDGDFCCNRKDGKYCCGLCTKKHNYAPHDDEGDVEKEKELDIHKILENDKPSGYVNRDVYSIE